MKALQLSIQIRWPYPIRYAQVNGKVLIYDGAGCYSHPLTEVYNSIATSSNDKYARGVTTNLGHWLAYAGRDGLNQNASPEQCRKIYEAIVTERYGGLTSQAHMDGATIYCPPGSSAHSISSSIVSIRVAFTMLINLGFRKEKNPFLKVRPARINRTEHRKRLLNFISFSHKRTPFAFYKIVDHTSVPVYITDGDTLIDLMREGGKRARWSQRDTAVFELLVSYGPRPDEVIEATLESWFLCYFGHEIKVRNKFKGPAPSKIVPMTALAEAAVNSYFVNERWKHDKRLGEFDTWAQKRKATYTPIWYAKFLKAKRIPLSEEPLFLSEKGNPYTREAYTKGAWERARVKSKINPTPHHIRHWFVNKRLRQLEADFGDDITLYYRESMKFVDEMGWEDPFSVLYYDHEGRFMKMIKRYRMEPKLMEAPKSTAGRELMDLAGVPI